MNDEERHEKQETARSTLIGVLDSEELRGPDFIGELEALLALGNANGYTFRATHHAYQNAKSYLENASAVMSTLFPRPSLTPDGEGGIDVEWTNRDREVTLSCRSGANQQDY